MIQSVQIQHQSSPLDAAELETAGAGGRRVAAPQRVQTPIDDSDPDPAAALEHRGARRPPVRVGVVRLTGAETRRAVPAAHRVQPEGGGG